MDDLSTIRSAALVAVEQAAISARSMPRASRARQEGQRHRPDEDAGG
jgi:hypothetical protein